MDNASSSNDLAQQEQDTQDENLYGINNGDVAAFHLHNGQTVIAKIEDQTDEGFVVRRPTQLIITPQGVALLPWLSQGGIFAPLERATIPYDLITMPRACPAKLEELYRDETNDIAVPPKPSIVLA